MKIKYRPKLRNQPTENCLVPILAYLIIPGLKNSPNISTGIKIPLGKWSYSTDSIEISKETKIQREDFQRVTNNLSTINEFSVGKSTDEIKAWVKSAIKAAKNGKLAPDGPTLKGEDSFLYWYRQYMEYKFTVGFGKRNKKPLKPKTKTRYTWAEERFVEFEKEHGQIKVSELNKAWQKKYRSWISHKYPTSFVTRNNLSKKYAETLDYIRKRGKGNLLPPDPEDWMFFNAGDVAIDFDDIEDIAPTPSELKQLMEVDLDNVAQRRARDLYLLNIEIGQRIETLLRIDPKNSTEIDGAITYTGVPAKTKGKKVNPVIVEEINIKSFNNYFPWHNSVKDKDVDSEATILRGLLKQVAKKAGLNRKLTTRKMNGKNLSTIETVELHEVLDFKSCRKYAITEYSAIYDGLEMKQTVGHEKGSQVQQTHYLLPKAVRDNAESMIKKRRAHGSILPE